MRYGFVLDQDRCIGCHACTVACKEENQVPVGVFRTWVKYIEKGEFPHTSRHFGVMRCNHCDAAPCIEICPTQALYRRSDGIVDFDNRRCIGCKSCMQACPYDALYIDPNTNTAAKCNFCAHRIEANMQPACVIVCPTQAIVVGDLDDPASKVSRIVATEKVSVRKPQKGTEPKLFYVGVEGDLLQPTRLARQNTYAWAEGSNSGENHREFNSAAAREVYDVLHPAPWGWKIAAYLWTKAIAAGVLLVAALLLALGGGAGKITNVISPVIALAALGLTTLLLVFDLKRPDRFIYLFTKSNFRSWLVLGGYILMAYGLASFLWLLRGLLSSHVPGALVACTAGLAIGSACYSAFLFAQAKGRDLWQSPMFVWHLLVQSLIAGSAFLWILGALNHAETQFVRRSALILLVSLAVSLTMVLLEIALPHVSEDARLAMRSLVRGRYALSFWTLTIAAGLILPIVLSALFLLSFVSSAVAWIAPLAALAGVFSFEDMWVKAGQSVPLS
jgi:Fe-S-cluster-containing dehydrogenase component/formate-dependent nitrite reductase membrane component NrfD